MDAPPGKVTSHGQFRRRRCGVYDLTYEDTASPHLMLRIHSLLDGFQAVCDGMPYVWRQLVDTVKLAPAEFVACMVTTFWRGIYPAINLYWLSVLLDMLGDGFTDKAFPPGAYWSLVASLISCAMVDIAAGRMYVRSLDVLTNRFRAHFIPQLISASLRVDLLSIHDLYDIFPVERRFGFEFPGGPSLPQLCQLMQSTLSLASRLFVLLHAISRKRSPEREILLCFYVARGLVWWLAPLNCIGCSAFIHWPNSRHFKRMESLFCLAFSTQYRADLMLDGITTFIETEYKKSAEQVGDVGTLLPTPWCIELSREWYWDFLMGITLDNLPMAMYALILPAYLSSSTLASMMLLWQAINPVLWSIEQYTEDASSLLSVCSQAKRLYDAINYQSTMPRGTEPFPRLIDCSYDAGIKISFRRVSLRYPGSDHDALCDVSFEILPGEFVLIVGTNGSGKSSVLKLLARLFDPTAGEIFVDDLPLVRYDTGQLRSAMAFQSQSPVIYPVTVRENITFGLPPTYEIKQEHVKEAARLGGCSEWIARLSNGYDTQLQPSFDDNQGWTEGTFGFPSKALTEELARHKGRLVSISGGEKQRLATARTFMRMNHRTTRLLVVDEATSSLDPVAERDILTEFCNARAGKTIIFVTHRFHHLAHEADRILCMKDGRIVESGTHALLVRADGEYAALYRAQAG